MVAERLWSVQKTRTFSWFLMTVGSLMLATSALVGAVYFCTQSWFSCVANPYLNFEPDFSISGSTVETIEPAELSFNLALETITASGVYFIMAAIILLVILELFDWYYTKRLLVVLRNASGLSGPV